VPVSAIAIAHTPCSAIAITGTRVVGCTQATLRIASLSGVVNRVVDLRIPSGTSTASIDNGGMIPQSDTTSAIDLDQLFNLFDEKTRKGLQDFIRGQARLYDGEGDLQNAGWRYLNPSLVAASRLFNELNRDSKVLSDFLVSNSKLVTDLAERDTDLVALVDRLATTTGAIACRSTSPVERCGMPSQSSSRLLCVPLPAPGGPRKMIRIGPPSQRSPLSAPARTLRRAARPRPS